MTPRVLGRLILVGGFLVALTIGSVTYLQSIGRDPEPMLKLAGLAVTCASSLGAFVLQLTNRATVAKVERETGRQGSELAGLADALYSLADALPGRHAYPDTVYMQAAPAPPRSE